VRAAKPLLSLMGKSVVHLGDAGAGQVAKICNNLVGDGDVLGVLGAVALC
jgi:3-hydroxyisobutyrate dehydrogenase